MGSVKAVVIYISVIVSVLLASIYVGYKYIIVQPNKERLGWVEGVYNECVKTSSELPVHSVYVDIQEVTEGKHSSEKLKKYADIFKDYSLHEKCELDDKALCLESFLYVARAFLARGGDKDIKAALNVLGLYQDKGKYSIYFDTVMIAIALSEGNVREMLDSEFNSVLQGVKNNSLNKDYYSVPHNKKVCNVLLDHVGAMYAKIGEFSADIYIQTNIVDD